MKKFAIAVLLCCLFGNSCLFANLKVHFVGDVSKETIYNLPSWIEPTSIDSAEWVIKIKKLKVVHNEWTPFVLGFLSGCGLIAFEFFMNDSIPDGGPLFDLGMGLTASILISSSPVWSGVKYKLDIKNINSSENLKKKIKTDGPPMAIINSFFNDERTIVEEANRNLAPEIADFFEKYYGDKMPPKITLSSLFDKGENITSAKEIMLSIKVDDDVELSKVIFNKDSQPYQSYPISEANQLSKSPIIPLKLGYNYLRIEAYDWMNKSSAKEVTIFRSKGGGDTLPIPAPPVLSVKMYPLYPAKTLMGGTDDGIKVSVHNIGEGYAYNVKVALSGDEILCNALGNSKKIEDIAPSDSAIVTFRKKLPSDLERKQTRLEVSVTADNYTEPAEDALTLTLLPEPVNVDVDIPSSNFQREGHALVIGISQYQRTQGPSYARNDAEVFCRYAEHVLGIPASNITLLIDEDATWKSIERKAKDISNHHGWRILYFAGHGSFDLENPLSKKTFLAPYDWDPVDASSLLSLDWLLDMIDPGIDDTTFVILDACYTGGEGRSVEVPGRAATLAELPSEHKSIVMASSEGSQISYEFNYTQHGMFTYYLLSGLKGNAADLNGWVYLDTLYDYVCEQVSSATDSMQIPVIKGGDCRIKIGKVK